MPLSTYIGASFAMIDYKHSAPLEPDGVWTFQQVLGPDARLSACRAALESVVANATRTLLPDVIPGLERPGYIQSVANATIGSAGAGREWRTAGAGTFGSAGAALAGVDVHC